MHAHREARRVDAPQGRHDVARDHHLAARTERQVRRAAVGRRRPDPARQRHGDALLPRTLEQHQAVGGQRPEAAARGIHPGARAGRLEFRRLAARLPRHGAGVAAGDQDHGSGQEQCAGGTGFDVHHVRSFPAGNQSSAWDQASLGPGVCIDPARARPRLPAERALRRNAGYARAAALVKYFCFRYNYIVIVITDI